MLVENFKMSELKRIKNEISFEEKALSDNQQRILFEDPNSIKKQDIEEPMFPNNNELAMNIMGKKNWYIIQLTYLY